jgi:hypothetical protein
MDRDAIASQLRRTYAVACSGSDTSAATAVVGELERLARTILGPSFRFEPDLDRKTDATPARMSGLRPVALTTGRLPPPDDDCTCYECRRARAEKRPPNPMQHYGGVGRAPGPSRISLSVIPGGAAPSERPSARYIDDSADDSADDAPKAG